LGYDRSFASPRFAQGIFPAFEKVVLSQDDHFTVWRDERGITRRDRRDGGSMPEFLDYPVKSDDDWEKLKSQRLDPRTRGRFSEDWPGFRRRLGETGQAVQVGAFPFGVFGTPRDLLGVEELLIAFYDRPALVQDMMDHLSGLWIALFEQVASEVQIDHIHIWEDMSGRGGSLISPDMVRRFMMPCYDRIAHFAREARVRLISVDTDGDCSQLVPVMMDHGVNVFFPFEVQAGNDILEYRTRYPTLGILGGLDKRCLASSKRDVDRELAKAAQMVKAGRYIPGFDHLIPPDATWENFRYAAEGLGRICGAR
jgi:uroporphyrinogen decarboxylase